MHINNKYKFYTRHHTVILERDISEYIYAQIYVHLFLIDGIIYKNFWCTQWMVG